MDYTELVLEQCPEVVAEYVTSVDPDGLAPTLWPNDDFQGDDYSLACRLAVAGYVSPTIKDGSNSYWVAGFVRLVRHIYGDAPEPIQQDLRNSLARIAASGKPIPGGFFATLRRYRIDIRDAFLARHPVLPLVQTMIDDIATRQYVMYRASFDEPDAFARTVEMFDAVKGPGLMSKLFINIHDWRIPHREKIYMRFKDDGRRTSDVNGDPGLIVATYPRIYLGLPRYTGPTVHMDEEGRPFPI